MTRQQLLVPDLSQRTVYCYVDVATIDGHTRGRLVSVGRQYARVMFGNGEVVRCKFAKIQRII